MRRVCSGSELGVDVHFVRSSDVEVSVSIALVGERWSVYLIAKFSDSI